MTRFMDRISFINRISVLLGNEHTFPRDVPGSSWAVERMFSAAGSKDAFHSLLGFEGAVRGDDHIADPMENVIRQPGLCRHAPINAVRAVQTIPLVVRESREPRSQP
jgi:hypothetical protein